MLKILSKGTTSIFLLSAAFCLLLSSCENPFMQKILDFKTVSFNTNGGSSVPDQNLIRGWKITRPDDPVKFEAVFDGWYIDNDAFLYEWDFDDIPAADMILYAKWIHTGGNPNEPIITTVSIIVTGPAKDETPAATASGTGNFTIGDVSWSPNHNPFQGGMVYTVSVTLTAHDGYTFASELTATVNGNNAAVSGNNGHSLTLSYTFAETDTRTVTGVTIKTQPHRLTYTHGDHLDLTGLEVTLTFDTDETEDIALDSFVSRNISTEPSNGTPLVHIAHNGIVVTVEYGHHSADTEPLTVNPKVITFTIDTIPAQPYTGSAIEPTVTVRDGATLLALYTDYTVTYTDNINEGTASVTIAGAGNYAGSTGSTTFHISAVIYRVTFNADGGEPVDDGIVIKGDRVTKPADPTKDYTLVAGLYLNPLPAKWQFDDWYNGDDKWDFNATVTGDMTLTARWINPEEVIDLTGITTGTNNVEKAFAYLNGLTTIPGTHTLLVDADVTSIVPQTLYTMQDLTIQGLGAEERIIQYSGAAASSLFTINGTGSSPNTKLTLGENVTLKGIPDGLASLVSITNGTLVMEEGSKITEHANTNTNTDDGHGGGVSVFSGGTFTMNGGEISGNSTSNAGSNGGGVYVFSGGTFTMNDGKISDNTSSYGGGVSVVKDGTFTMNGGEISGNIVSDGGGEISDNSAGSGGGGVIVGEGGFFDMNDGKISGNTAGKDGGGGVSVWKGTFTMTGGEISSGNFAVNGGGVNVGEGGIFDMYGGKISGNSADKNGGGVNVWQGIFTMIDGEISRNTVTEKGGGVTVSGYTDGTFGTFIMNGGEIKGNETTGKGGGVQVLWKGTFTMDGGKISDNSGASDGGGVHIDGGTFKMTGGEISGNTTTNNAAGGGVYFWDGEFIVGGTAKILDNHRLNGEAQNAHLYCDGSNSRFITLDAGNVPETGTGGMEIHVSTNPFQTHNGIIVQSGANQAIANCFHADEVGNAVGYRNGQIIIVMDTVSVEGGTFTMGSPSNEEGREPDGTNETQHSVTLTGFNMSKYQVTQKQWWVVMRTPPSFFDSNNVATGEIHDRRPVEQVSWYDAIEFCNALSQREGLIPYYIIDETVSDDNNEGTTDTIRWLVTTNSSANGYRLPTEAQWEYACRAGTTTAYNVPVPGGSNTITDNTGWYYGNSGSMTHEVGKKPANEFGLYDMHGNVWEWCWDWYKNDYYSDNPQNNPTGPESGSDRVIRGGGWGQGPGDLRSARRGNGIYPAYTGNDIGFRVVRPVQ
jgi:formylglycine-generating enzyme required for sulfatase activity